MAPPRDPLQLALGIDVRGVDEIDAGVDRKTEQISRGSLIELADDWPHLAASAERHGAEADFRDEKASAAEFLVLHGNFGPGAEGACSNIAERSMTVGRCARRSCVQRPPSIVAGLKNEFRFLTVRSMNWIPISPVSWIAL